MFLRWYRRWRLKRSGALFRYYNGRRIVWADVLTLYRKIIHHEADIVSLLPAANMASESRSFRIICSGLYRLRRPCVIESSPLASKSLPDSHKTRISFWGADHPYEGL